MAVHQQSWQREGGMAAWPWWNSLLPSNNIISLPEGASLPWRLKNHLSEVQTNRDHSWIKMKMCRNEGHPPRARAYLPRCTTAEQQRLLTPVLDSAKSLTLGDTYVLKLFGPKEISPLIGSNGKSQFNWVCFEDWSHNLQFEKKHYIPMSLKR